MTDLLRCELIRSATTLLTSNVVEDEGAGSLMSRAYAFLLREFKEADLDAVLEESRKTYDVLKNQPMAKAWDDYAYGPQPNAGPVYTTKVDGDLGTMWEASRDRREEADGRSVHPPTGVTKVVENGRVTYYCQSQDLAWAILETQSRRQDEFANVVVGPPPDAPAVRVRTKAEIVKELDDCWCTDCHSPPDAKECDKCVTNRAALANIYHAEGEGKR